MRIIKFTVVLISVLILSVSAATIVVDITNIKTDEGTLYVALFKPEPDFPNKEKRLMGGPVKIEDKKAFITFSDLPGGDYAISAHHDINSNQEVDKNFLGMPKEPYGFSNNLYGPFGKPDYKKATIKLNNNDSLKISIKLR